MTQFRPISLCNVAYKIITKTIVLKLRRVMTQLAWPNQVSFISSRCITENIVIAQEVIHTMRRTRSTQGWMAVKVNLEKAYDRMR